MEVSRRIQRIRQSAIPTGNQLEQQDQDGLIDLMPKKEASMTRKELERLRKHLNGIRNMKNLPDLVIVVDQKKETTAIQECIKLGVPTICMLDTNCNPEIIDVPIPSNDDAIRSIKLVLSKISDAILEGRNIA